MKDLLTKTILILLLFTISTTNAEDDELVNLYKKFKPAMAITDSLTINEWIKSLPTSAEKNEMFRLIDFIYPLSTFDELNKLNMSQKFPKLAKSIQLTTIENNLCVIHEPFNSSDPDYKFPRYFGIIVIRAEQNVTTRLHHSAAHFETDGLVDIQALTLFISTQAKSLVIAGASRWAVNGTYFSHCQTKEAIADAAHNTNLMFHIANVALLESSKKQLKGQELNDHFIQWHGMAETSCPKSPAFISIGANGSNKAYNDSNLYANKLKAAINNITGDEFAQTPKSDTICSLRATNNVFGRVVNGVHFGMECNVSAQSENIKGNFMHIEQKRFSRNNLTLWQEAFEQISAKSSSISCFTALRVLPIVLALKPIILFFKF